MAKAGLYQRFLPPSLSSERCKPKRVGKDKLELSSQALELSRGMQRPGTGRAGRGAGSRRAAWQLVWISAAGAGEPSKSASRRALQTVEMAHI